MPEKINNTTSDSYANIKTSIGYLYLFDMRVIEIIEIEKILSKSKKSLEDFKVSELLKFYLPYFVHLKEDLIGENLKRPEKYTLEDKDINKLSKKELEDIAKSFLDENEYLIKNIEKEKEETNIEYFYKVILEEDKLYKKRLQALSSAFSPTLSKNILETIKIGNALKNSLGFNNKIKGLSTVFKPLTLEKNLIPSVDIKIPEFDFEELAKKKEENRLAPFNRLELKMDAMIEAEKKAVSWMSDIYNNQVNTAIEVTKSSDSANKNSKRNIRLTKVIIALTIISTLITSVSFGYPIWFNNDSSKLITTNYNINESINKTNKKLEILIQISIEQNKIYNQKIKNLELKIESFNIKSFKKESS